MSVYIEYVIIDNMAVDSLLLALVLRSLKEKGRWWKILLSAGLGTALAATLPLFVLPTWITLAVKLLLSAAMVLIVKEKKKFILYLLLFYLYTFLFGGACIGIFYFLTGQMIAGDTLNYTLDVPIGFIIAGVAGAYFAIRKLLRIFYKRRELENFLFSTELVLGDRSVKAKGYLDSGNLLTMKGEPVVLVTTKVALSLFGISSFSDVSCHKMEFEYIEISTVSGKKQLPVFRVDKLFVDAREYSNIFCGISFEGFRTECDVLLNCQTK